jgi:gamma-glutamyltranspeptidase/glutathione hydrolase
MRLRDAIPGGLSVGVPGDVAMLAQAHKEHGKLPWAKLFEPAIALAENGFTVPPRLGAEIGGFLKNTDMPDVKAAYFHADGTPYAAGETMKNAALAKTFRAIAAGGPDAFYKGALAQEIVDKVQHAPHHQSGMTLADLAAYKPQVRPGVCAPYRGYRVCSMQAGNGGITVLQILGELQRFPSSALQPETLSQTYLMSEAEKLSYADRVEYLGDPAFVTAPVSGMLDASYLQSRAALIDPEHALSDVKAGTPPVKHAERLDFAPQVTPVAHGTSHLTIVDDAGNVVSMTTSVESGFGSHVMAGGFILNNELTDFSFEPERDGKPVANAVAPGKRPLSAMSPMIVFGPDGKFFAAIGSPGGRTIICYVAQALVALIDGHASMPQAVSYPHHVADNGTVGLEKGTAIATLATQLTAMGDTVHLGFEPSGLNGIRRVAGGYEGGSDPRRDGIAAGD